MLKLIRMGAIERPWFFRTIMFIIAGAFIITMGWWGLGPSANVYVAQIDEVQISREEYRRTYENIRRVYRNLLSEGIEEETIKKIALESLVERQLWLKAADQMGLKVTLPELTQVLSKTVAFHKKGRFDPDQYRIVLANSRPRLSPEQYENSLLEDLLLQKAQGVVRDGVVLTPQEIAEAKARILDPGLSPEKRVEEEKKAVRNALMQKKQRALSSYIQSVRASSQIQIEEWRL